MLGAPSLRVALAALAVCACANPSALTPSPGEALSPRPAERLAAPAATPSGTAAAAPAARAEPAGAPQTAGSTPGMQPPQTPALTRAQEQRRALLDVRRQVMDLARTLNQLIAALGPAAPLPRERPAMVECPWPMPAAADTAKQPVPAAPPGVIDPPRPRIPDCAPPGWQPPARLEPFTPPPVPADRPEPLVANYLAWVVAAPPPEIIERFQLDTAYYRKYADATGYPILASARVPDAALAIVRDQVNYLLGHRPDIRETMISHGGRIVIMAETEYTMDIPEQRNWTVPRYLDPRLTEGERASYYQPDGLGSRSAEAYWNARARGMGGTLTSCAEENVLGYYNTRYWGTNICVHEFSHAIMGAGIGNADPRWFQEIVDAYRAARAACAADGHLSLRTARGYAGNTFNEYWAAGVEWYIGNGGRDRAELKVEDPTLYELVSRLIPEDRGVPLAANVARQTRQDMNRLVQEANPEWWQREQRRQEEQRAARGAGGRGEGAGPAGAGRGAAGTTTPPCTPAARD